MTKETEEIYSKLYTILKINYSFNLEMLTFDFAKSNINAYIK